eukprot:3536131-Rhodomonas_salina.1
MYQRVKTYYPPFSPLTILLRACYALSGTDIAYGAARLDASRQSGVEGTRYVPTRLLRDVRY